MQLRPLGKLPLHVDYLGLITIGDQDQGSRIKDHIPINDQGLGQCHATEGARALGKLPLHVDYLGRIRIKDQGPHHNQGSRIMQLRGRDHLGSSPCMLTCMII